MKAQRVAYLHCWNENKEKGAPREALDARSVDRAHTFFMLNRNNYWFLVSYSSRPQAKRLYRANRE